MLSWRDDELGEFVKIKRISRCPVSMVYYPTIAIGVLSGSIVDARWRRGRSSGTAKPPVLPRRNDAGAIHFSRDGPFLFKLNLTVSNRNNLKLNFLTPYKEWNYIKNIQRSFEDGLYII
jgi:hypothetical protein